MNISFEQLAFYFPLFTRTLGFFVLSPLFSHLNLSYLMRFSLCLSLTLCCGPLVSTEMGSFSSLFMELIGGYLLGTLASFFFEGLALTAQIIESISGLTLKSIFSLSMIENSPVQRLVIVSGWMLFFLLDMHHLFLRLALFSFPIKSQFEKLIISPSLIFEWGLIFSTSALVLFIPFFLFLGFASREIRSSSLFWIIAPLQMVLGVWALMYVCGAFPFQIKFQLERLFSSFFIENNSLHL